MSDLEKNVEKLNKSIEKFSVDLRELLKASKNPYGSQQQYAHQGGYTDPEDSPAEKKRKQYEKYQTDLRFRQTRIDMQMTKRDELLEKVRRLRRENDEKEGAKEEKKRLDKIEYEQKLRDNRRMKFTMQFDVLEKRISQLKKERESKMFLGMKKNIFAYEKALTSLGNASFIKKWLIKPFIAIPQMLLSAAVKSGIIKSGTANLISKVGVWATGGLIRGFNKVFSGRKSFGQLRDTIDPGRKNWDKIKDRLAGKETKDDSGGTSVAINEKGQMSGSFNFKKSAAGSLMVKLEDGKEFGSVSSHVAPGGNSSEPAYYIKTIKPLKQDSDGALITKPEQNIDYNRTDNLSYKPMFTMAEEEKKKEGFFEKMWNSFGMLAPFLKGKLGSLFTPLFGAAKGFGGKILEAGKYIVSAIFGLLKKIPFVGGLIEKVSEKFAAKTAGGVVGKLAGGVAKAIPLIGPLIAGGIAMATTEGSLGRKAAAGAGAALGSAIPGVGIVTGIAGQYAGSALYDKYLGDQKGDATGAGTISDLLTSTGVSSLKEKFAKISDKFGLSSNSSTSQDNTQTASKRASVAQEIKSEITNPSYDPSFYGKGGPGYTVQKDSTLDGVYGPVKTSFERMASEYKSKTGKDIFVTSGFRTHQEQIALKRKKPNFAATPGTSPHEFGYAIDVNSPNANALDKMGLLSKYGFTRPALHKGEPWHLEPVISQSLKAKLRSGKISYADGDGMDTEIQPRRKGGRITAGRRYLVGEDGPEVLQVGGEGYVIPKSTPQELNAKQNRQPASVSSSGDMQTFLLEKFLPAMASMMVPSSEGTFVYKEKSSPWD